MTPKQKKVWRAGTECVRKRLAEAGLLAVLDRCVPESKQRLAPVRMEGKPLSQIVIEERDDA